MEKKRIEWIDSLRGTAMFFVILGHCFIDANNAVRTYVYSFHMPLFFFVSGLIFKDKNLRFKDFCAGKCRKILLPYVIINFFTYLIKIIMHFVLGMYPKIFSIKMLESFFTGIGSKVPCVQTWFLLTLFLTEILFQLIRKISKNDKNTFIIILCLASLSFIYSKMSFHIILPWHFDSCLIALLYYYCGYIFMKNIDKFASIFTYKKRWISFCCVFLLLGITLSILNGRVSMNSCNYNNVVLFIISSFSSILFYTMIVKKVTEFKIDKVINNVGICSMFYLAYHSILISIIKNFWPAILGNNFIVIIVAILDLMIIYLLSRIVYRKLPILIGKI